ncbi:MAG TPA: sulfotransferase [Solirubrobacteraceae bacterium]|nr:sulfotransferase [Solirubrobacteraceae bacterium]
MSTGERGDAITARELFAPDRGAAASGRVPNFFIVGQPKSGTTALYEILRRHPQIFMPDVKEPLLLATDLQARSRRSGAATRRRPDTFDEYLSLFAPAEPQQRVGEASALYLWSRDAAANIAWLEPAARIIAIFREPASFLRSLHLQLLQNHTETQKDLRKALSLEQARSRGKRIPRGCPRPAALLYSERVRYAEQLSRYQETFAPEQLLVMIYDDFRADNEETVRSVLRFLDVDDTVPIETTEANPTVRLRSRRVDAIVHEVSVGRRHPLLRTAKAGIKALTSERMRRVALRTTRQSLVFGEPDPPDERLAQELRARFKPEVVALSDYLGRDLVSLWGYGSVD